ncbi:DUF2062 domain-containing protein [Thermodesulfobacteriota bacterium]
MNRTQKELDFKKYSYPQLKHKFNEFVEKAKKLQGDPHHIAMGMALGVFVGVTPTFPFHTAIALFLAFVLRGSKLAALFGVWIGNPFTMPFFYLGSYMIGTFLLGHSIPFDIRYQSITKLLELGLKTTLALLTGGVILGIPPALGTYFIARKAFTVIRARREKSE